MDNTEKLLRALINELGYEVEEETVKIGMETFSGGGHRGVFANTYKFTKKATKQQRFDKVLSEVWSNRSRHDFGESVL